jgi:hypothetical protein
MVPPKVLVVSPLATHPPHRGNRQRILQIARLLRESGFDVDLAIGRNRKINDEAEAFWPVIHRLKQSPRWKPTNKNVPLDTWYTPGLGEEIADIVELHKIDVVLLNYIFHSKLFDHLPPNVMKIIDTHDVFTNRRELYVEYRYTGGFFSCTSDDEATYLRRADVALSISPDDTSKFKGLVPELPIIDLPFLAHNGNPAGKGGFSARPSGKKTVGMVLSGNDLNVASLHSFIAAVDDQYGRTPPFNVLVVGDIHSRSIRLLPHRLPAFSRPWLRYVGQVRDIYSFYENVDVIAVPVIAGSGMAIKFSEAILADAPVISTANGSRGHQVTHELHRLDNNRELAKHLGSIDETVVKKLREAENEYQASAHATVQKGWTALCSLILDRTSPASASVNP